jgi:ABC-type nickel/cobalt efflux system permease component RcnA
MANVRAVSPFTTNLAAVRTAPVKSFTVLPVDRAVVLSFIMVGAAVAAKDPKFISTSFATVNGVTTVAVANAVAVLLSTAQAPPVSATAAKASASFVIFVFVFILNSDLKKRGAKLPRHGSSWDSRSTHAEVKSACVPCTARQTTGRSSALFSARLE